MNSIEAERFLNDLGNSVDTTSFNGFIEFVVGAAREGFTVIPYSEIDKSGEKHPQKEFGATVFGEFPNADGEMVEVASNPVCQLPS
jgi:hypothetical protein